MRSLEVLEDCGEGQVSALACKGEDTWRSSARYRGDEDKGRQPSGVLFRQGHLRGTTRSLSSLTVSGHCCSPRTRAVKGVVLPQELRPVTSKLFMLVVGNFVSECLI